MFRFSAAASNDISIAVNMLSIIPVAWTLPVLQKAFWTECRGLWYRLEKDLFILFVLALSLHIVGSLPRLWDGLWNVFKTTQRKVRAVSHILTGRSSTQCFTLNLLPPTSRLPVSECTSAGQISAIIASYTKLSVLWFILIYFHLTWIKILKFSEAALHNKLVKL